MYKGGPDEGLTCKMKNQICKCTCNIHCGRDAIDPEAKIEKQERNKQNKSLKADIIMKINW